MNLPTLLSDFRLPRLIYRLSREKEKAYNHSQLDFFLGYRQVALYITQVLK